jgi:hypothetical protein
MMRNLVQKGREEQELRALRTRSAIIIQRAYRKFRDARLQVRKGASIRIIAKAFKKFLPHWRKMRLRCAANLLQAFFKEVYDVSKLMKIVKKYRLSGN